MQHRFHRALAKACTAAAMCALFFAGMPVLLQAAAPGNCAASPRNTCQWAWNDEIGWISHNSTDNPSVPVFGAHIDETAGTVSGFAWNEAAGWIDFAPTSGFPSAPLHGVRYDAATGQLSGWAQIQGYGGSGWIKLRDSGAVSYGVSVSAAGDFSGYAWSDVFGWFDFAPAGYPAVHHTAGLKPSVSGWAWNDALGWVSLNFTAYDAAYGVQIEADGSFSGYAWSDAVGWIDYHPSAAFPSAPSYSVRRDSATGQLSGWAHILSMGADGWVKFRSAAGDAVAYGVTVQPSGDWSGYAWNEKIGWINFEHALTNVFTAFASSGPVAPVLTQPLNCVDMYVLQPSNPLSPTLDWNDFQAYDASSQAAFQIQIDDDPAFSTPFINQTVASTASNFSVGLGELTYNVAYYWRVRVQSSEGEWSGWGLTGPLGTESNCFRTPKHPAPVCDFSYIPVTPAVNVETAFTDKTQAFGGATAAQWTWNFGDGQSLSGADPLVHKNPKHTYQSVGQLTISLSVTDSDGYACTETKSESILPVLPEYERVIPRS